MAILQVKRKMPTKHRPRRGSLAFSPRKRAKSEIPRYGAWSSSDKVKLLGFSGYKVGMTHVIIKDDREYSPTKDEEIFVPVTVIETPNMKIAGIRAYKDTTYGLKPIGEVWTVNLDKELKRRVCAAKNQEKSDEESFRRLEERTESISKVRAIAYTRPKSVSGVSKKIPEIMEIEIGGEEIGEILEYSKSLLGREIKVSEVLEEGEFVDVSAITRGKGFQGPVKRWGIMTQNEKQGRGGKRRHIGNLGPWFPSRTRWTVPQAGQLGYQQRTEFNKEIISIGEDGGEIIPDGGFVHYGVVKNPYLLVKGSVPGPKKRLIRMRGAMRMQSAQKISDIHTPEVVSGVHKVEYISLKSQQGR
ncbi:MAG: 50S ribosomal protein L3 [Candidatus Methanolliviera sp. GoM_asphalt]|nr:MAG: 50S ribosomal protein L3 [Candidatus Methanolliviera sp. GoM_asphalt]